MGPTFEVGQIVELVNQPPDYDGRTLDGTLARVETVNKKYGYSVFVEIYKRHRRNGRPLALRTWVMPVERLRPVTNLTPEQANFLDQVEPLRQDKIHRRQKMREDRLAWEKRILSMAQDTAKKDKLAEQGLAMLESRLIQSPPVGVTSNRVRAFFEQNRATLLRSLIAAIDTALDQRPSPLIASSSMALDLERLSEEAEFEMTVQVGGTVHKLIVIPDVDGFFVRPDTERNDIKIPVSEPGELLTQLPTVYPALAGGRLVAVSVAAQDF